MPGRTRSRSIWRGATARLVSPRCDDLADLGTKRLLTPQPQKRPRSSFVRFAADLPNERWQADITHWRLRDGTEVEIL